MELEDIDVGRKYLDVGTGLEVIAIFAKAIHSVFRYRGYVLVQYIGTRWGWDSTTNEDHVPHGEDHIYGLSNLLWIAPGRIVPPMYNDVNDGYEVD